MFRTAIPFTAMAVAAAMPLAVTAQDVSSASSPASSAQEALSAAMRPAIYPHIYNVTVPTDDPCKTAFFVYQTTQKQTKIDFIFEADWTRVRGVQFVEGKDQKEIWWTDWIRIDIDDEADDAFVPLHVAKDQIQPALNAATALKEACRK